MWLCEPSLLSVHRTPAIEIRAEFVEERNSLCFGKGWLRKQRAVNHNRWKPRSVSVPFVVGALGEKLWL